MVLSAKSFLMMFDQAQTLALTVLPVLVLFVILQRYIISGVMAGSVKA
jgi:ABC-type glycerol-3-phosphate transport system permease component